MQRCQHDVKNCCTIIADRLQGCKRGSARARQQFTAGVRATAGDVTRGAQKAGRGERIRTSGLYVPNVALYQAKLHPDALPAVAQRRRCQTGRLRTSAQPTEPPILAEPRECAIRRQAAQAHRSRACGFGARRLARGVERAGARARWRRCRGSCVDLAVLDRMADRARAAPACRARMARISGSVGLPSRRSSPTFLPSCVGVAFVVEHVVDELEGGAERLAVGGAGLLDVAASAPASTAPSRALASNSLAVLKRITRR